MRKVPAANRSNATGARAAPAAKGSNFEGVLLRAMRAGGPGPAVVERCGEANISRDDQIIRRHTIRARMSAI